MSPFNSTTYVLTINIMENTCKEKRGARRHVKEKEKAYAQRTQSIAKPPVLSRQHGLRKAAGDLQFWQVLFNDAEAEEEEEEEEAI